jgi:oxaloacetate decarboxylase gamma subunit
MFEQSGLLSLLGMGTVFAFLIILIYCITILGKIIHFLGLDKEAEAPVKPQSSQSGNANGGAVTAAITAAVTEYRKTHN